MEMRRLRDLETLPDWATDDAGQVWRLARNGGTPRPEQEAGVMAYLDHPEFALLSEHQNLPPRFAVAGVNPRLHVMLHSVVEAQLLNNDPPEARGALAHLLELGIDRHASIHLLMQGLLKDIHTALQHEKPSGYVGFLKRMSLARIGAAAATEGAKVGRNDSCPCGSGKKFKKCCGADGPVPFIDLSNTGPVLGDPYYAGENGQLLPPGHKLVTLDNMAAVAHALEAEGVDEVAREAYRRMVAFAETVGDEYLDDALEDQMEFALNHPDFAADGVAAVQRLIRRGVTQPDLELSLAELHTSAGQREQAEALYQKLLAGSPGDPWVYISWAKFLEKQGRTEDAKAAYQTVIDQGGMGDGQALGWAMGELAKL